MKAMVLRQTVSLTECRDPLTLVEVPIPNPGPGEVLLRVLACGVCHTELDEIEGRTPPPKLPIIPGHQVVGRVERLGEKTTGFRVGDRVGVGWIHSSTGALDENLSDEFRATGRDVNGGYAEFMTVPEDYAYPIPASYNDDQAAPLLCAGAIGYRALRLTAIRDGQRLGLMGFGSSGHLVLQLVRYLYPNSDVFVFARDAASRQLARETDAAWTGDCSDRSPDTLDAIIDTTPAWSPVINSLSNLKPGGRLVINAIRKEDHDKDQLLRLSYENHLWMEREIKTVANITQFDIREFLPLAATIPIQPRTELYRLAEANRALLELKSGIHRGSKVLMME